MGTIVDLSLELEALPLGQALASTDGLELELEPVVPIGPRTCPFFWLFDRSSQTRRHDRIATFERRVEQTADIDDLVRVGNVENGVLYRVGWCGDGVAFVDAVVDADGAILEATGTSTEWTVRLRFGDSDRIATFQQYCREHGIPIELVRVVDLEHERSAYPATLTSGQAEALMTASRMGYFERPRETTLAEVATSLEVSPQAAGGRIRRGVSNLVADALPIDDDGTSHRSGRNNY
ncbi:helix-turn-helix domain-containing protein [Halobacteria archaeon AArc-m2/3/4]|uniref:Helix-turn-helix domain-containing protein n=1 Tax=Natronoglomus mannanivorans TaxID=2979990 RepID=A0AAP2YWU0_9EURY|nr:helix-turn-helix domain-containing protein [Halobacteria archaeon AArc-xg1-1]MCU4971531.1 helix-turn-helix domain-containing protein [Halobacteria archaeon AArc-m2/3/4]